MSSTINTFVIQLGIIKHILLIDAFIIILNSIILNYIIKSEWGQNLISHYRIKYINKQKVDLLYITILCLIVIIKSK